MGLCAAGGIAANTKEVLYLANRPGNVTSHKGCVQWIDRAIDVVPPHVEQITLRGDTDLTLTSELDRWHGAEQQFIFGMDAYPKVVGLANELPEEAWKPLEGLPLTRLPLDHRANPARSRKRW